MSEDSSEEKTLPPSTKKLRDARKKGQIAKSRDFVGAIGLLAAVIFVASRGGLLVDRWRAVLIEASALQNDPFSQAAARLTAALSALAAETVLPLLVLVLAATILGSIVANQGVVFSLEPLKPQLSHLDPVKGLGRLFALKAFIELAKTFLKGGLLGASLVVVVTATWRSLILMPSCGAGCFAIVVATQTRMMLVIGAGGFLVAGAADVLIQRWLFLRDMKMSASEQKREYKEQEGDPHVRNAHRRHRREAAGLHRAGLTRANILIRGHDVVVGLRFVASEVGAPVVVCRAKGPQAAVMVQAGAELGIIRYDDHALAADLVKRVPPGTILPRRYFDQAARAIFTSGLA